MSTDAKKTDLLIKAGVRRADEEVLSDFSTLADQSRFASNQIYDLMQCSSDREIARTALIKARKPGRY
jgi:hypothetical protein